MSFPQSDDEGIDCFVLALEDFSPTQDDSVESSSISSDLRLTGWVVDRSATQNEHKSVFWRSAPSKGSKEQRLSTPRRTTSRQLTTNREDLAEFKHYLQPGRYIDEYRTEKVIRQEAAYRDLLNKNYKGRTLSDNFVQQGKKHDQTETVASKKVPTVVSMKEVQTPKDENDSDKPLVVSSKGFSTTNYGFSKLANLPLSGQFQGRKLQWRPAINNRKIPQPKASQWSQAHFDATLEMTSEINDDLSHKREEGLHLQEVRPSTNLIVTQADLTSSMSSLRPENKRLSVISQPISAEHSPIERCDAWVKNRDNELGTVSTKAKEQNIAKRRSFRGYNAPQNTSAQLVLRGNSLASPQKDTCRTRTPESHSNMRSPARSSTMDYSKYTDMFKNVLEFYGTRRLRPKSHSTVEQLLSMKT